MLGAPRAEEENAERRGEDATPIETLATGMNISDLRTGS
jgi:hypothetical protein